ncbi:MAG: hypothetical protein IJ867_00705 [Clostridia bacterium]|nr:hypothetical protein [Clostridia bacterium]
MEEKKSNGISVSGFFLIIAIIIIIAMGYFIYKFYNDKTTETKKAADLQTEVDRLNGTVSELQGKINSISENINVNVNNTDTGVENKTSTIEDTLPQLAGKFFDIDLITKESGEIQNVKNYKDFEYDLDSDGIIDKITLKHVLNENEDTYSFDREYYILDYNGNSIYDHWQGNGKVSIVDLDETDKYLDILVYDDGPSDDPVYYFYRKSGSQIIAMGKFSIERSFLCDGKGKILSADRMMPWVSPQVFNCYYVIEDNKFRKNNLDFSYNKDYEYTSSNGFFTTDLENLKLFENEKHNNTYGDLVELGKEYNIIKLDETTKFKIIEFVKSEKEYSPIDLKVILSDGTEGYLIHPYRKIYDI